MDRPRVTGAASRRGPSIIGDEMIEPVPIEPDIAAALTATQDAKKRFEHLPPSHRREYLNWIAEAKKPATRQKRIAGMIEKLTETAAGHGQA